MSSNIEDVSIGVKGSSDLTVSRVLGVQGPRVQRSGSYNMRKNIIIFFYFNYLITSVLGAERSDFIQKSRLS